MQLFSLLFVDPPGLLQEFLPLEGLGLSLGVLLVNIGLHLLNFGLDLGEFALHGSVHIEL